MIYLLEIHGFHGLVHASHDIRHAPCDLPHGNGCLHPARHGIDPASEAQEVEALVLFTDSILGVDLCDIVVALLYCLWERRRERVSVGSGGFVCMKWGMDGEVWDGEQVDGRAMLFTFLSLSFSVFSSLLALAAWRFSCFAVNWRAVVCQLCAEERGMRGWGRGDGTFKLKRAFSRPDMMGVGSVARSCMGWMRLDV